MLLARPHCLRKLDRYPSIHKKIHLYPDSACTHNMYMPKVWKLSWPSAHIKKKAYFSWDWVIKASLQLPLFPCPVEKYNFYFVGVILLLMKGWWSLPSVFTLTRSRSLKRNRLLLRQTALDWHITLWSQRHLSEKSVYSQQATVLSVYRSEYYLKLSPVWFVSLAQAIFCISFHIFLHQTSLWFL